MPRMYESEETKQLIARIAEIKKEISNKELEIIHSESIVRAVTFTVAIMFSFITGMGVGGMVFH